MLCYDFSKKGNSPIYEYIYRCIRDDILSGRLKAGDRLPSKREMSSDNGIAVITVENAYAQLLIEGYIESKPRKGYFVATDNILTKPEDTSRNDSQIVPVTGEKTDREIIYDFTSGGLIYDSFPYSTWTKLIRKVLNDAESDFGTAPPASGVPELKNSIAEYLLNSKNLKISPDNIIVGPGTEYLHSVIIQLLGHNRLVAVEDPGYRAAGLIYENNGMKVLRIPVGSDGIDIDRLSVSGATLVHTSPSHHFPTGAVMSAGARQNLIKWAHNTDAYVIEDDYDTEFRFKGKPIPALMSLDRDRVIYMNTFSGTIAPSIRMAYMVLPDRLNEVYNKRLSFLSGTVSTFDQLAMAQFISLGYYERHIGRMRNRYRILRKMYKEVLAVSDLAKHAFIEDDQAGLRLILNFTKGDPADDERYLSWLKNHGIKISAMNNYCYKHKPEFENRFVLRYADMTAEELKQVFDIMAKGREINT
ncbi:MAG: PLP-dependent aminotransferase family protein [Lachnospiraceae bacterium]|nr:PLP-dependent aminotransferase family protein [Lachnospiraceae bacterium]